MAALIGLAEEGAEVGEVAAETASIGSRIMSAAGSAAKYVGSAIKANPMNSLMGATMAEETIRNPVMQAINAEGSPQQQYQSVSHAGGTFNRQAVVNSAGYSMSGTTGMGSGQGSVQYV